MRIIISLFTLFICSNLSAQKLAKNERDEFTNQLVKQTEWENFAHKFSYDLNYRISKVDTSRVLEIKIITPDENFVIERDADLMLKLFSQKVIILKNLKTTTTCKGCGAISFVGSAAQGIYVLYPLTSEQFKELKENGIEKMRIYTSNAKIELEISEKKAMRFIDCLKIIQ